MPHHTPLIGTIVAGLVVAFLLGAVAQRLKVSPIAGYLLAGVMVGPFTPGFVADAALAAELAEIGVILLMFGVGLHFSVRDLMAVRKIAIPGAIVQIATATALGAALAYYLGWGLMAGLVFGLALSVASTVVLLRALESRNLLQTNRGRISIGWLIVEDIAMVLALVLLPAIAGTTVAGSAAPPLLSVGITILKVAAFLAIMMIVGRRVIPWALHWVVHTGSRELFRLAVLAIALGVAFGAAYIFGVSFALGAFFAGMILGETQLSRRAAEETLPLRDAFAVLFFVSVGMLFDPSVIIEQPLPLVATVVIIVFGKSLAAYAIVRAFKHDHQTAVAVSASLAQIGEFSFILAGLGTSLAILPSEGRDLILAGAIISILLHPFLFSLAAKRVRRADVREVEAAEQSKPHVIVVGYGRVGKFVASRLNSAKRDFILIDDQSDVVSIAEKAGVETVQGNAAAADILREAGIDRASHLLIAIPEGFEAGGIAEVARKLKPDIRIIARAHSTDEVQHLFGHGANEVIMGEEEIARRMVAAT